MEYTVRWTIDIDAASPEDAARRVMKIHRSLDSWATVFEVRDAQGDVCEVDLGVLPQPSVGGSVYVLVPLEDGMVKEVAVYASEESAQRAEQKWLSSHGLADEKARRHASDFGTGIAIWECNLIS